MKQKNRGNDSEQLALKFLKRHNLKLITKNFSCRFGEIDLVMLDQNTLVFVEVRQRSHQAWGSGLESVDYFKQQRLIKTALYFLSTKRRYQHYGARFDVLSLDKELTITWIKSAFQVQYQL